MARQPDRLFTRQVEIDNMSADSDLCSPSRKRRTENTATNCSTTTSQPLPTPTATPAAKSTPSPPPTTTTVKTTTTASSSSSCAASEKETTSSSLEACQKDSIIAQILAGTDADFAEATLCPPGVFFDDSCYSSTNSGTPCSFSPHDSWVSLD